MTRSYSSRRKFYGKPYNPRGAVCRKSGLDLEDYKHSKWNYRTRKVRRYDRMRKLERLSYQEELDYYESKCGGNYISPNRYTETK